MMVGAPALRWSALLGAGAVTAVASVPVQLAFATVAIGVVGMAHGASDLAVITPARRPAFLSLYLAVAGTCLAWWLLQPALALPLFLLASAIHFGLEDAPSDRPIERLARGSGMILVPATLHAGAYATVLALAGGAFGLGATLSMLLPVLGGMAALILTGIAIRQRNARLATGTAALLLLPPLVGFSVGFLVLHALPQTAARRQAMGCPTTLAYVRAVAPVLGAAVIAFAAILGIVLTVEPTGVRALFAAIAALALPHLLVTPFFDHAGLPLAQAPSRPAGALLR